MRHIRRFAPAFLAAVLWIAQVQGTLHAIGHLGMAGHAAGAAATPQAPIPYTILCADCTAFAQAGAAPLPAMATPAATIAPDGTPPAPSVVAVAASAPVVYRSRAPPTAPI